LRRLSSFESMMSWVWFADVLALKFKNMAWYLGQHGQQGCASWR
jgi:hypothetical protein